MRLVQVSVPSGAGQCTQRCRSVYPAVQVRFRPTDCARDRHPGPFSGAGPHHQNGPAPFTSLTCTVHRTLLRHPLHPPAPLTLLTCTTHPLTCAIHRFLLRHWLHRPGPQQGPPPAGTMRWPLFPQQRRRTQPCAAATSTRNRHLAIRSSVASGNPLGLRKRAQEGSAFLPEFTPAGGCCSPRGRGERLLCGAADSGPTGLRRCNNFGISRLPVWPSPLGLALGPLS